MIRPTHPPARWSLRQCVRACVRKRRACSFPPAPSSPVLRCTTACRLPRNGGAGLQQPRHGPARLGDGHCRRLGAGSNRVAGRADVEARGVRDAGHTADAHEAPTSRGRCSPAGGSLSGPVRPAVQGLRRGSARPARQRAPIETCPRLSAARQHTAPSAPPSGSPVRADEDAWDASSARLWENCVMLWTRSGLKSRLADGVRG